MAVATAALVIGAIATVASVGVSAQQAHRQREVAHDARKEARAIQANAAAGLKRDENVARQNSQRDAMRLRRRVMAAYSSGNTLKTSTLGATGTANAARRPLIGG